MNKIKLWKFICFIYILTYIVLLFIKKNDVGLLDFILISGVSIFGLSILRSYLLGKTVSVGAGASFNLGMPIRRFIALFLSICILVMGLIYIYRI